MQLIFILNDSMLVCTNYYRMHMGCNFSEINSYFTKSITYLEYSLWLQYIECNGKRSGSLIFAKILFFNVFLLFKDSSSKAKKRGELFGEWKCKLIKNEIRYPFSSFSGYNTVFEISCGKSK